MRKYSFNESNVRFNIVMELIKCSSSKRIKLADSTQFVIGRRSDKDSSTRKVSRSQVSLISNSKRQEIHIKNLGINPIRVNEFVLVKQEKITKKIKGCNSCEIELPVGIKYKVISSDKPMDERLKSEDLVVMNNLIRDIGNIQNELLSFQWKELDNGKLMVLSTEALQISDNDTDKVAAFDMDGTLIKTKSGKAFPVDENDWLFYCDSVESILRRYSNDGFKIVIFSNQGGIAFGSTNKKKLKTKIERVVSMLKIPVQVYLATSYDFYRKPCPGMWFSYLSINKINPDYEQSFYVGDAAGRPQNWCQGKKKDHSNADRLFARNIKMKFVTPEEFYFGQAPVTFKEPDFDPSKLPSRSYTDYDLSPSKNEVIIMVGSPGSGKSHFVERHLLTQGYISISRDVLGTWQNCVKAMEKYLELNKSIVIDNTNPNIQSREKFIAVAKTYDVPVRCFIMESTIELCKHNNKFRQLTDSDHSLVSDVIINDYWKKLEAPRIDEGFTDIVFIPFVPTFSNNKDHDLYKMYLQ